VNKSAFGDVRPAFANHLGTKLFGGEGGSSSATDLSAWVTPDGTSPGRGPPRAT
jgi:hypothetical protein